jgi:hypothetical protein
VLAGAGALALLALVFAAPWYGVSGRAQRAASQPGLSRTVDGWDGLTNLRWLMLLAIVAGLGLTWLQATRRAPALPVSFSPIAVVLGLLTVLALIYRVLIDLPGAGSLIGSRIGAYLGLLAACVLTFGAFRSLREENPRDGSGASIPTITVSGSA